MPYDDRESCLAWFATLEKQGTTHLRVICLATLADDDNPASSLKVPLALCGALQKCGLPTDLLFLTHDAVTLAPEDRLRPSSTMIAGLARCIGQECSAIQASSLDISHAAINDQVDHVLDELGAAGDHPEIALRGRTRWAPKLVPSDTAALAKPACYKMGDVHVIFGGTGHVGLALASEIAKNGKAQRILLVCRTAPTDLAQEVQQTIANLNQAGADVSVHSVDITNLAGVQTLLSDAASKTGRIAQVIHAAGVVDPEHLKFICKTSYQNALETVSPHVAGAETLAEAVSQVPVTSVILCSSLSCSVGGLSYGTHAAGHRYLDAVAARETAQKRSHAQWVVIDYDTWRVPSRAANIGAGGQDWAIEPNEGFAVLALASAIGAGRYAASTPALSNRPGYRALQDSDQRPVTEIDEQLPLQRSDLPALEGDTISAIVTACFEEVLEIDNIDPEKSFFDLGGESLLFLDVLDLLKERAGLDVPQTCAFEAMCTSDMIKLCEQLHQETLSATA